MHKLWWTPWFSLHYQLWGCILTLKPHLFFPYHKRVRYHPQTWMKSNFTSSQKEVQTAINVKKEKASFLYLLSMASSLLPIKYASVGSVKYGWKPSRISSKDKAPLGERNSDSFGGHIHDATIWPGKVIKGGGGDSFLSSISNLTTKPC